MSEWVCRREGDIPEPPLEIPRPIWALLHARGIEDRAEIEQLFSPTLKDMSHPMSIDQMDLAVDRLVQAKKNDEVIGLYGDYDLDGTPGLALLKTGLTAFGFEKLEVAQPFRLKEGYGIHRHLIDELKEKSVSLIVTVDVGIADNEAVDYANGLGIDVIVTDHHLPKEELPKALAIINPNKGTCGSGLGHLSGTGVAFYLMCALKSGFEKAGIDTSNFQSKELLDLFAIATITDMVPLVKENRVLVKHGLKVLEKTKNPGLYALMKQLDLLGRQLNTQDISFKLAPKLNALSRLEEGLRPLDVFMADQKSAKILADEVFEINDRRREYQKTAEAEAIRIIEENEKTDAFVFAVSEKFHPGVVSVVANKLMEKYKRPCFLGAAREDGRVIGSSRSPDASLKLPEILEAVSDSLEKFGGHAMAAGFETTVADAKKMAKKLAEYFAEKGAEVHSAPEVYDCEISVEEINESLMKWHESLEPFGMGFEQPKFFVRSVRIQEAKTLKGGHMRYKIASPTDRRGLTAPWFGAKAKFKEGDLVNLVFEPQWNYWMGKRSLQLMVKDMWAPETP